MSDRPIPTTETTFHYIQFQNSQRQPTTQTTLVFESLYRVWRGSSLPNYRNYMPIFFTISSFKTFGGCQSMLWKRVSLPTECALAYLKDFPLRFLGTQLLQGFGTAYIRYVALSLQKTCYCSPWPLFVCRAISLQTLKSVCYVAVFISVTLAQCLIFAFHNPSSMPLRLNLVCLKLSTNVSYILQSCFIVYNGENEIGRCFIKTVEVGRPMHPGGGGMGGNFAYFNDFIEFLVKFNPSLT